MSLDQRAQVLNIIVSAQPRAHGVKELIQKLKWKTSRGIFLLRRMRDEGLIESQNNNARHPKRGRPKKIMKCTSLGYEFLETYKQLKMKPLRARREDLEHAVKDALYTERLISNGHSPFKLFIELNTIVSNIKISSETT